MEDSFDIPVTYKNKELLFPARLIRAGYIHKFEVIVNDCPVFFEQDDQERYRAIADISTLKKDFSIDIDLLKAIAEAIEDILS
jgi:hypothetical protein